ncbi:MAG: DNA (cytosine-5-)-methyltransferase [Ruminococcus sp.]|nr:DNA (cytosine-5-)-methyltransferase [Ruminococcus sp.]
MKIETFFDFCSGIGAGRLGLEQCGFKCVGRSDTSRLADITYKLMHSTENEKNYGDLRKIQDCQLPNFDLLIAGFPCQSFSVIGKQEGFKDNRGQIIFHIARLLAIYQPKCFILENVKGLVTHDNGKTIKTIINVLNQAGYITSYRVIASLNFGVPQMRERVYFIGFQKNLKIDVKKFRWPQPIPTPNLNQFLIDEYNHPTKTDIDYFMKYLVNPINASRKYSFNDFLKEEYLILDTRMSDMRLYRNKVPTLRAQRDGIYYIKNSELRYLSGYEALLLQGFPKYYADKVKTKVSNRHLLMQAGNAMTVNVINALGNCIKTFFNQEELE